MEFERTGLEVLLKEIPYDCISLVRTSEKNLQTYDRLNKTLFIQYAFRKFNGYSENEVENIFDFLIMGSAKCANVFELIEKLANKFLRFKGGEICYCLEEALRWREVSFQLGADIFVASYVAGVYNAYTLPTCRWKGTIASCKSYRGLAENHFHLQGSTKIFDVNWISLMNKVVDRKQVFAQIGYMLDKKMKITSEIEETFAEKCYKAALYRVYLYTIISRRAELEEKCKALIEEVEYVYRIENSLSELQDIICCCKMQTGNNQEEEFVELDYAVLRDKIGNSLYDNLFIVNEYNTEYRLLLGERYLLTECFRRINNKGGEDGFNDFQCNVFYRYIVLRNLFRSELIQTNYAVGFKNFENYQTRKKYFIVDNDIYEREMIKLAINVTAREQEITSLEARICPPKTADKLEHRIRKYQKIFNDSIILNKTDLYFVLHFPKYEDSQYVLGKPRHFRLRNEMRETTYMLEDFLHGRTEINAYIRGIDACANEIGCRPEVFAPYFREMLSVRFESYAPSLGAELKHNPINIRKGHFIKATYHVGEDFLDIIDGLRAIDEAILFCDLKKGDRLGHALALGINSIQYYELKRYTVCLEKQDLLDNLVWMYQKITEFDLVKDAKVKEFLANDLELIDKFGIVNVIDCLLKEMYPFLQDALPFFDERVECYYEAWKLRGDVPGNYLDIENLDANVSRSIEHRFDFNSWVKESGICDVSACSKMEFNAIKVYHDYHFNEETRKKGTVKTDYKINRRYAYVVELLQDKMMDYIERCGIAIETNPSSNHLIGTISKYDEHPILRFNSEGLLSRESQHKISVSINTDDQGVFDTSLENEYTLMYLAAAKAQNEDGSPKYCGVENWIQNIIEMGNSQAFKFEGLEE